MLIDSELIKVYQEYLELIRLHPSVKLTKEEQKQFSVFWKNKTFETLEKILYSGSIRETLLLSEHVKPLVLSVLYQHLFEQAKRLKKEEFAQYVKSLSDKIKGLSFVNSYINIEMLAQEALEDSVNERPLRKRERFFLQKSPRRP